ncbi:MAG TPA: hypothetical protein VIM46_09205 [Luteolibacter sp.]
MRAVVPMKFPRLILCFGIFGSGFATSWLVKPTAGGADSPAPVPVREHASNSTRPVKDAAKPRFAEQLKALVEARYNEAKTKEALDQVKTEDFPRLIDELMRKAGFTGLDSEGSQALNSLIESWYGRDADAALAWVRGIENTQDRESLLGRLIGSLLKKDFNQGFALLLQDGRRQDGGWIIPYEFSEKLGSLSEEEMLRMLGRLVSTNGAYTGRNLPIQLPDEFDYQRVLDGLIELKKGLKGKESLAFVPGNLLTEWAKRDPKSAWAWLQQGQVLEGNDLSAFYKGYRSIATTDEITSFLVSATADGNGSGKQRLYTAWRILAEEPDLQTVTMFVQKLPGDRSVNLRDLFGAATHGSGGNFDQFKEIVLREMSAAEREQAFAVYYQPTSFRAEEFYKPLLRQLGHSDEEIQRMLSPTAGH